MPARGSLTNLRPVPQAARRRDALMPNYAMLRIRAIGLNFRDVLNVMGLYPGDPGPPGADCSGTVLEVGEGVEHLRVAEDIFGEAPGCLSTYHAAPAPLLTQKPPTWSFEEASTMPVIFVTVEESLGDLAQLRKGEKVLIHAAAGGVGLVAIQYAQHVGAEVYATAGAEEKHAFLRSLGVKYITSSRNGERFEQDMRGFLGGENGIDVVLNSLSHDDYIPRSLALLKKGGRFMEIGKRGVWSHQQMRDERPDVMYEKIAADTMMEKEPWRYNAYMKRLLQRVDEGALRPIHMHTFDGLGQGIAAMQFLQRAQNIGKVVIREPSRMGGCCRPDATTLISGGLGALGVVTAQFLVEEGAKSLVLTSRGGKPAADVQVQWDWLQASAVTVTAKSCDASQKAAVISLRDSLPGPVAGLLHLAGVLADGMIPSLSRDSFQKSYAPKVHGLHHLCENLSFEAGAAMVLFSSTSALFGSPGQANYSASNSVLDSLAPFWTANERFQARTVQWGPWAEVGMAVQKGTIQRAKATGLGALGVAQGMSVLGSVLAGNEPLVGAAHVRWPKFLRNVYSSAEAPPSFLDEMVVEARKARAAKGGGDGDGGEGSMAAILALAPEERLEFIREAIHRVAREVVDSDDLSVDMPLLESGMDSLSGVEFRNRLLTEFGSVRIPNSAVFDYPTVAALAEFVNGQVAGSSAAAVPAITSGGASSSIAVAGGSSSSTATATSVFERLNDRSIGGGQRPLFLVPGAGMQSAGFRALASMLPVPVYGANWPRGIRPREDWPDSLSDLADLFLQEVRALHPPGEPLLLAGHSFGASVCLEMARRAEAAGQKVALVALLDPRSLPPVTGADLGAAFEATGLAETLALLSVLAPDGGKYAEQYNEVARHENPQARDFALQKALGPALPALEHVRDTSRWYASLLGDAREPGPSSTSTKVVLLRAAETWLQLQAEDTGKAMATVRDFQAKIFQNDADVHERVPEATTVSVPGGHFAMLHEPHVAVTALQLCHAIVEAGR